MAALAVMGALVPAALAAAITRTTLPLVVVPAVTFGVPAMTAPALYVALTLRGAAPPMAAVARAVGRGLLALALVQLGLAVPAGFLVATATATTGMALVGAALLVSAAVAAVALDVALTAGRRDVTAAHDAVLWTWMTITAVIAARLYVDVLAGVTP
jgi:hypothetical protein